MEAEQGTSVEPTPASPTAVAESSLLPAGPSASVQVAGGKQEGQVKIPEGGDDGGVGAEASADDEQDPPWNGGADSCGTVSLVVPVLLEEREEEAVDNAGEDITLEVVGGGTSTDDDEEVDEDDPDVRINDDTDSSGGESSSSATSESSGGLAGELHPMKNPVILANFFELLPPRLLANFRLVCMQWRDLSLAAWRSSVRVKVEKGKRGKIEVRLGRNNVKFLLEAFLKYVETPKNQCQLKPFRHFVLDGRFPFPLEEHKSSGIRKLWELVKRVATSLELYYCSFPEVEVFKQVIYESCPNLQRLELMLCSVPKLSGNEFKMEPASVKAYPENSNLKFLTVKMDVFPLTWLETLSHFPSLADLCFIVYKRFCEGGGYPVDEMLTMLQAIQILRKQDPRKLPLTQLYIHPCFDLSNDIRPFCQVFRLFGELSLPLYSLKLRMGSEDEAKLHELAGVVEMDCGLLQKLTFCQTHDGICAWVFPFTKPLDNLEDLTMTRVIWENMEFLKLFPNLTKLDVIDTDEESVDDMHHEPYESVSIISNTDRNTMADITLLKMSTLQWNYSLTEDELRRLINWFPNLKHLSAVLNDKLFAIVCEHWPDLDSLTVMGSELTDEGITGLRAGQIVDDTMDLPPNIKLLQKLEMFSYRESEKLTEVSVFNGLLKLPRLETLYLGETTGLSEISKAALEEVKNIELLDWP